MRNSRHTALFITGLVLALGTSPAFAECKILVVEDTLVLRTIIVRAIQRTQALKDCEIVETTNSEDAIAELEKALNPENGLRPFSHILMDSNLTRKGSTSEFGRDGQETTRIVREELGLREPYIVAISTMPEGNKRILSAGGNAAVLKGSPSFIADLVKVVTESLTPDN